MAERYRVTVEPVLFLHMLATFMLFPAVLDLIYSKVCSENYSKNICSNLHKPENHGDLDIVQTGSAHWILASSLSSALPSMIVAQFLGTWSDTYSRKFPMLIPPIGAVFMSLLYIIMSVHPHTTHVGMIVVAAFVAGSCGGFTSVILTCMSYIAQASSTQTRTIRVGMLESMVYAGGTLGPLLEGWLQQTGGRSTVFTVILALHSASVIYIVLWVRDIPPRRTPEGSFIRNSCNCRPIRDSLCTVVRNRQENRRNYILALMAAISIVVMASVGEMDVSFLYMKDDPLRWGISKYTYYLSLRSLLGSITLLVILPLVRHLPDTVLIIVGLVSKIAGLVLLSFAGNDALAFISAAVPMFATWCTPIIRAAMSKMVEHDEHGKLFACVALIESACALFASGVYTSLYPATRHFLHGFVFLMAAISLFIPIVIVIRLHKSLKKFNRYDSVELEGEGKVIDQDTDSCPPSDSSYERQIDEQPPISEMQITQNVNEFSEKDDNKDLDNVVNEILEL